jgi:hypothetical protein
MLKDLLQRNKKEIVGRWFDLILDTYPPETGKLLKAEKDRFVNPVGTALSKEIEVIYDQLAGPMDPDQVSSALEKIIQIRSVQDFTPSQAVSIVHLLKRAILENVQSELKGDHALQDWLELESGIDHLSLLAFDLYTKFRERMYEIRIRQLKQDRDRAMELMARMEPRERQGVEPTR